ALFVLDPLPNLFPAQAAERLPTFIDILRSQRPDTPILLVGSPRYADAPALKARADRVEQSNRVAQEIVRRRTEAGDSAIFFAPGADFAAEGGEATVDGTHPTDLGMLQTANILEPFVKRALAATEAAQ